MMDQFSSETVVLTVPEQPLPVALSPAACLLRDGLVQRWDKYIIRLQRCQLEFTEENVHDLRVSMRRLMAILVLSRAVLPMLKTKNLRQELKFHLDSLDGLRDAQVMLLFLRKYFHSNPAAAPLIAFLSMQETHLIRQVGYDVSLINSERMAETVNTLRAFIEQSLTGTGVKGQILAVVDEAFAVVQWRRVNINPDDLSTVHAMRIAYKKFRYMIEIAGPLIPAMPTTRARTLQRYQAMMGDIQDMVVFLQFIDQFAIDNPQFNITPVRVFISEKCNERMEYFLARINRLDRFWRKTPAVRFPWRSTSTEKSPRQIMEIESE
jgi:CHAD domain-containing protein